MNLRFRIQIFVLFIVVAAHASMLGWVMQRETSVIPLYAASSPITMSLLTLPEGKNEKRINQTKFYERDFPTKKSSPTPETNASKTTVQPEVVDLTASTEAVQPPVAIASALEPSTPRTDAPKTAAQPEVTDLTSNDLPASTEAVQPPVATASPQEPSAVEVVAVRFDADYLHNPGPRYPMLSSRFREEGTVYLHVQVHADGYAMHIVVKNSSGYSRLDQAGIEAVKQWRFVPARQGKQAINSWAIVPIKFSLKG